MSSVPLLLESFPAPPSFIPSTPTIGHYPTSPTTNFSPPSSLSGHSGSTSNPPPSRPPSVPLPPIPRNSRDSDVSFVMLSPQSRTARPAFIRSRSETHYSSAGSARPDSVMSTASAWSIGKSYEGHALDIHREEEEAYDGIHRDTDDDEPEVQLTRLRMSISPMPSSPEPGSASPVHAPSSLFHFKNRIQRGTNDTKERELLSAVSMNDLPPSSDIEDDVPPNKRVSSDSIASVATSSSVVVLQSSLRRNKPKRISTGDVHRSSLLPNSASSTSLTSNSAISPQSLLGSWPNTPNTPFVYTQPPTPLTPAFTESEIDSSPVLDDVFVPASPSGTQAPTDGASSSIFTSTATSNSPEVSVDPHALHRELRSARSRSRGHRERLGMIHPLTPDADTPPLPSTPMSATLPSSEQVVHPPPPNRPIKSEPVRKRSTSPDLTTLLSETRSRTRSRTRTRKSGRSSSGANTPLGGSASARNSHHSAGSASSRKRIVSEGFGDSRPPSSFAFPSSTSMPARLPGSFEGASTPSRRSGGDKSAASVTSSSVSRGRKTSQRYLDHNYDEEERRIRRLERELDGEGSGSENELDRGRDIRGFGFDGIERVEGDRGKRGSAGRNTNRDTMDDIFGEYLGSEAGSEYGSLGHGEEDREEGGSGLGSEGEDSDSSLDLHTPLPNLMVRQGLLSPHSKLLLQNGLGASVSIESLATCNGGDDRPASIVSVASKADSLMTKSGIPKDARDTVTRRQRHKDGKLLRGGLGLTTGLGWSDSEDEDAPSSFTRRVTSTISLSRHSSITSLKSEASRKSSKATSKSKSYGNLRQASSVSSLRSRAANARSSTYSSRSHGSSKLSRSYSSRTLGDFDEDEEVDEFGYIKDGKSGNDVKGKEKLPPTSWQGKSFGLLRNGERMRTASESSASAPYGAGVQPRSLTMPQSHSREEIETPSTASSVSIPLPVTPDAYDFDENGRSAKTPTVDDTLSKTTIGEVTYQRLVVDKDKMLPPLPNPKTGSIRRPQAGALAARRQASAAARGATLSIATAEGITLAPSSHETIAASNSTSTASNSNSTTVTASSIPTPRRSGSRSSSLRSSSSSASLRNASASQAQSQSQSQIPPVPTLPNQPLRQLQLPRYSGTNASSGSINTHKQTAVPVPSTTRSISGNFASTTLPPRKPTLSGSMSAGSLRSPQGVRTAPSTPVTPSTPGRPRTGTGMTYRRSGSVNGLSALKLPSSRSTGAV